MFSPATPTFPLVTETTWARTEGHLLKQLQQTTGVEQLNSENHNWLEVIEMVVTQTQVIQPLHQPWMLADLISIIEQRQMLFRKIIESAVIPVGVERHTRCHELKGGESCNSRQGMCSRVRLPAHCRRMAVWLYQTYRITSPNGTYEGPVLVPVSPTKL